MGQQTDVFEEYDGLNSEDAQGLLMVVFGLLQVAMGLQKFGMIALRYMMQVMVLKT